MFQAVLDVQNTGLHPCCALQERQRAAHEALYIIGMGDDANEVQEQSELQDMLLGAGWWPRDVELDAPAEDDDAATSGMVSDLKYNYTA